MRLCMLVLLPISLLVVETTVSQTCSPICESGGSGVTTCSGDTIEDCTTSCGAGACKETSFRDSQVTCTKEEEGSSWSTSSPCIRAIFIQSTLELSNSDCISCSFWFSAITTNHELAAYSGNEPLFGFCSCCDDSSGEGNCPEDVPSCTAQEFCSDTVHFRTCKDWGNPACDNVDIPSVPSKTDASNCSTGEDVVWCLDGDCRDADISNCTAICLDGSCEDSTFDSSVVGCHYSACNNIAFNKSFIGLEDAHCNDCSFWFSAVTTNHELASWSSDVPTFGFCSCCDDTSGEGRCPEDVPSCTTQEFCSDTVHFRTCKDWGNPACNDLDIPSQPSKTDASTCSTGEEVVWCRNGDCNDVGISNCTTICLDGSCDGATFDFSVVGCHYSACNNIALNRSFIGLENAYCNDCSFWFSAITTNHALGRWSSDMPAFGFCSCCDDTSGEGHCPEDVPSCTAQDFCSDIVHFRTCKDWGNPACNDLDVPSAPSKTDASTCSTGEEVVWCRDDDCHDAEISNCTTICLDESCDGATFDSSVVGCHYSTSSCRDSSFNRSIVKLEDANCNDCSFWFSAVTTNHELASWSSDMPLFGFCSCCDDTSGEGYCPEDVPSCTGQEFCSDTVHFRTCKDWGNPACDDLDIPSVPAKTDASTCSTGEEVVWCRDEDCHNAEISNCTTICLDQSCRDATFHSSVVGCHYSANSCRDVSFNGSIVKLEDANCNDCSFWFSAVTTDHEFASWLGDSMPVFGFCS